MYWNLEAHAIRDASINNIVVRLIHAPCHCVSGDKRKSMRAGGVVWEGMGFHEDLKRLRLVRGLSNDSGLNNCFLNVVIQCLWHLRSFREALLNIKPQVRAQEPLLDTL